MFRFEETSQNAKKEAPKANTNASAKSPNPPQAQSKDAPKKEGKKAKPRID